MPSLIQKHIAEADARARQERRSHGSHPRWPEQRQPCGEAGRLTLHYSRHTPLSPDISDCLAWRSAERPWLLTIWEPLLTKAPAPPKAAPYCCYLNTVIFCHAPYIVRPFHRIWRGARGKWFAAAPGSFEQWDQIETRFTWDDLVRFEGELFEIGGGTVIWARRRWWMCRGARRKQTP